MNAGERIIPASAVTSAEALIEMAKYPSPYSGRVAER
jgi:hypothetical protein